MVSKSTVVPDSSDFLPASELPDVPWYKSCRLLIAFISLWGYTFFYILRVDLSMAIVCMVKDSSASAINTTWNTSAVELSTFALPTLTTQTDDGSKSDCLADENGGSSYTGELEWSKELRGYMLSSFFYGYLVTQVPGGWLAKRFGGKHVFGIGLFITSVATLLVPVAARVSSTLVIVLRVIMGAACGVGIPATHHLYAQWFPPFERSRLASFSYAGTYLGTIVALFFSGLLCNVSWSGGWPLIFYIFGGLTLVWLLFWQFFVYNSPSIHPRIDPREREYIIDSIGLSTAHHEETKKTVPWKSIAISLPVWAINVTHTTNNWANYTMLTSMPMYVKEVLKFDVEQNGAISSAPQVAGFLGAIIASVVADYLIGHKILSITVTRKLFQCLSSAIPAVLIVATGFMDCSLRYVAVALISIGQFVNGLSRSGYNINHIDLSPRHAGILFGISNTFATIPGMIAPSVVGILTPDGTREQWLNVFFVSGALYVFSTIFYAIFGSGDLQPWALTEREKQKIEMSVEVQATQFEQQKEKQEMEKTVDAQATQFEQEKEKQEMEKTVEAQATQFEQGT
jgi:ACS family sodium-dependent inorganic phosphate cotransporter-like MFS transporter 5